MQTRTSASSPTYWRRLPTGRVAPPVTPSFPTTPLVSPNVGRHEKIADSPARCEHDTLNAGSAQVDRRPALAVGLGLAQDLVGDGGDVALAEEDEARQVLE